MFCCVRRYGGQRARRTTMSPTGQTPFPFRPMHAWLVWCWPACVWSVYGHVVAAAVDFLVHGRVSRLLVGLFGVGSLALQRAPTRSDVVRVVVMLVSVLVGDVPVALGRHGTFRLCAAPPSCGRKVTTVGFTAEKSFQIRYDMPCPALAALHAQPIIWYFAVPLGCPFSFACAIHMYTPSVARPRWSPWVHLRAPHGCPSVLLRLGGAVLLFVSACLSCAVPCRVSRVMWLVCRCRSAVFGG